MKVVTLERVWLITLLLYFVRNVTSYVSLSESDSNDRGSISYNEKMMLQLQAILTDRGTTLHQNMVSIQEQSIVHNCIPCSGNNNRRRRQLQFTKLFHELHFKELFTKMQNSTTTTIITTNDTDSNDDLPTNSNTTTDVIQFIEQSIPSDITVGDFLVLLYDNPVLLEPPPLPPRTRRHLSRELQDAGTIVLALLIIIPLLVIEVYSQIRGIPISCLLGLKRRLFFGLNCSLWFEDPCPSIFDKFFKNRTLSIDENNSNADIFTTDPLTLVQTVLSDNSLFSTMNDLSLVQTLIDIATIRDDDDKDNGLIDESGRQKLLASSLVGGVLPILSLQETATESHTTIECILTNSGNCRRRRHRSTRRVDDINRSDNDISINDGIEIQDQCKQRFLDCERQNILSLLGM